MRLWPRPRRWRERRCQPSLIHTGIEVRVGGQVLLGPMTLETLALIGRYGGYGDLLWESLVADGHPRTEIILSQPTAGPRLESGG